jgi:hypothetical protein
MRTALRMWYFRALAYLDQFKDEAPACCGTCRACAAATAGAVTGLVISSIRRSDFKRESSERA